MYGLRRFMFRTVCGTLSLKSDIMGKRPGKSMKNVLLRGLKQEKRGNFRAKWEKLCTFAL
jgi:hypothetical protein